MQPSTFTIAHELYHAIRKSAKCFGFEGPNDEAEAYLFERALEYFTEKLANDRRKLTADGVFIRKIFARKNSRLGQNISPSVIS